MKNGLKKFLAMFLALVMCFGMFPASVLAEENEELPAEELTEVLPAEEETIEEYELEEGMLPEEEPFFSEEVMAFYDEHKEAGDYEEALEALEDPEFREAVLAYAAYAEDALSIGEEPAVTEETLQEIAEEMGLEEDDAESLAGLPEEIAAEMAAELAEAAEEEAELSEEETAAEPEETEAEAEESAEPEEEPAEEVTEDAREPEEEPEEVSEEAEDEETEDDAEEAETSEEEESGLQPAGGLNAGLADPVSGSCGDSLTWKYAGGLLTISGSGAMADYQAYDETAADNSGVSPWYAYREGITAVSLEKGITYIGKYAFSGCTALGDVYYSGTQTEWSGVTIDSGNDLPDDLDYHFASYNGSDSYEYYILEDTTLSEGDILAKIAEVTAEYTAVKINVCSGSTLTLTGNDDSPDCSIGYGQNFTGAKHIDICIAEGSSVGTPKGGSLMLLHNSEISGDGTVCGRVYALFGYIGEDVSAEPVFSYDYEDLIPISSDAVFMKFLSVSSMNDERYGAFVDCAAEVGGNYSVTDGSELIFNVPFTIDGNLDIGRGAKVALAKMTDQNVTLTVTGNLTLNEGSSLEVYDDPANGNEYAFAVGGNVNNVGRIGLDNKCGFTVAGSYFSPKRNEWDYQGEVNINVGNGASTNIPNKYVNTYWNVGNVAGIADALSTMKSQYADRGYRGVNVNLQGTMTLDSDITIPEGVCMWVQDYWNDEGMQGSALTVPVGKTLTALGGIGVNTGCTLEVAQGGRLYAYTAYIDNGATLSGSAADVYLFRSNSRWIDINIDDNANVCACSTTIEPAYNSDGEATAPYIIGNGYDVYTFTPEINDGETATYLVTGLGKNFRSIGVGIYEAGSNSRRDVRDSGSHDEIVTLEHGQYLRIAPYADDENGFEHVGIKVVPYERPVVSKTVTVRTAADFASVPNDGSAAVVIAGSVELTKDLTVASLTVSSGAELTVPANKTLTVSGDYDSVLSADSTLVVNGTMILTNRAGLTAGTGACIENCGEFDIMNYSALRMERCAQFDNDGDFFIEFSELNCENGSNFSNAGQMYLFSGSGTHIDGEAYSEPADGERHVTVNDRPDSMYWDFIGNEDMTLMLFTGDPDDLFDMIWNYSGRGFNEYVIQFGRDDDSFDIEGCVNLPNADGEYNILMRSALNISEGSVLNIPEKAVVTLRNDFENSGIVNLNGTLTKSVSAPGGQKIINNGIIYDYNGTFDDDLLTGGAGTVTVVIPGEDSEKDVSTEDQLIEAAAPGNTVTLTSDITLTKDLTLTDCTLNLSGHTLEIGDENHRAVLTINRHNDDFTTVMVLVEGSHLKVTNGCIVNDGKIVVGAGGHLTLPDYSYRQNTDDYGGIRLITGDGIDADTAIDPDVGLITAFDNWRGELIGRYCSLVVSAKDDDDISELIYSDEYQWYRNLFFILDGIDGEFNFRSGMDIPEKVVLYAENSVINIYNPLSIHCEFVAGSTVNVNDDFNLCEGARVSGGAGVTFNVARNKSLRLEKDASFNIDGTVNIAEDDEPAEANGWLHGLEIQDNSYFRAKTVVADGSIFMRSNCNFDADTAKIYRVNLGENSHMNVGSLTMSDEEGSYIFIEESSIDAGTMINNGWIGIGNDGEVNAETVTNNADFTLENNGRLNVNTCLTNKGSIDIRGNRDRWAQLWARRLVNDCGGDNAIRLRGFCDAWTDRYEVDWNDGNPVCRVEYDAECGNINTNIPHDCIWASISIDEPVSPEYLEDFFWLLEEGFRNVTVCCNTQTFFESGKTYEIPGGFCLRMDGNGPAGVNINTYIIPEGCTVNVFGQLDVLKSLECRGTLNIIGGLKFRDSDGDTPGSIDITETGEMNIYHDWNNNPVDSADLFKTKLPNTEFELQEGWDGNRMYTETDCFVFAASEAGHYRFFGDGDTRFAICEYGHPDNQRNFSFGYPLDWKMEAGDKVTVKIFSDDGERYDAGMAIVYSEDSYITINQNGTDGSFTLAQAIRRAKENPEDIIVATTAGDIEVDVFKEMNDNPDLVFDGEYLDYGKSKYLIIPGNLELRICHDLSLEKGFVLAYNYTRVMPEGTLAVEFYDDSNYGKLFLCHDKSTGDMGTIFCEGRLNFYEDSSVQVYWDIEDPITLSFDKLSDISDKLQSSTLKFISSFIIECNAYDGNDLMDAVRWAKGEITEDEDPARPKKLKVVFCGDPEGPDQEPPEINIDSTIEIPYNMELEIDAYKGTAGEYHQRQITIKEGEALIVNGAITFAGAYITVEEGASLTFNGSLRSFDAYVENYGEININTVERDLGEETETGYENFRVTGSGTLHDCMNYSGLDGLRGLIGAVREDADIYEIYVSEPLDVVGDPLVIPWNVNLMISDDVTVGDASSGEIVNRGTITLLDGGTLNVDETNGSIIMEDYKADDYKKPVYEDGEWAAEICLYGGTADFNGKIDFTESPKGSISIDRSCYMSYRLAVDSAKGIGDSNTVAAHRDLFWDYFPEDNDPNTVLSNVTGMLPLYDTLNICLVNIPGEITIPASWNGVIPEGVYLIVCEGTSLKIDSDLTVKGGIVMEGGSLHVGNRETRRLVTLTLDGGVISVNKAYSDIELFLSKVVNNGWIGVNEWYGGTEGYIKCFSSYIVCKDSDVEEHLEDTITVAAFVNDMATLNEAIAWQNSYGTINNICVSGSDFTVNTNVTVPEGVHFAVTDGRTLTVTGRLTLSGRPECARGVTMHIDPGCGLTVANGGVLTLTHAEVVNDGGINIDGTLAGDDCSVINNGSFVIYKNAHYDPDKLTVTGNAVEIRRGAHTITYENMFAEDSNPNPDSYDENETVVLKAAARNGYKFIGWYKDAALRTAITKIPAGSNTDITLYAKWSQNQYQVKFVANGGTGSMAALTKKTIDDTAVQIENKFKRTGYTFAGWNTAAVRPAEMIGDTISIAELARYATSSNVITLYAQWDPIGYTVAFDPNGGAGEMDDMAFVYGTAQNLTPNVFTKIGYMFNGWKAAGKAYRDGQLVNNLASAEGAVVTMQAQWKADPKYPGYKYTVNFDGNGNTGGRMAAEAMVVGAAKALTACGYTKTGYHIAGWDTDPAGETAVYANKQLIKEALNIELNPDPDNTVLTSVQLYAVWEKNNYTITFNGNGGSYIPEGTTKKLTTATQVMTYDELETLNDNPFSRIGYTFKEWNTRKDGKGTGYDDGYEAIFNLVPTNNGKTTLYAIWTANSYTIEFNIGAGKTGEMADMPMTYDKSVRLNANEFHYPGYSFAGWSVGGTGTVKYKDKVAVKNLCTEDGDKITLTAVWTPNTYTVRFAPNGGRGVTPAPLAGVADNPVVLPPNPYTFTTAAGDYIFVEWNTKADGTGDGYELYENKVFDTKNRATVTLYAIWNYSVTFNPGTADEGTEFTKGLVYNRTSVEEPETFRKAGYYIAGWNKVEASAAKGAIQYKVNAVRNVGPDATLYAVWKPMTYSIKFDANGGTGRMANLAMTYGTAKVLTANAFKNVGYTFAGWSTTPKGAVEYGNKDRITNELVPAYNKEVITLYAVWTPVS